MDVAENPSEIVQVKPSFEVVIIPEPPAAKQIVVEGQETLESPWILAGTL
jgi:hypothetical protein